MLSGCENLWHEIQYYYSRDNAAFNQKQTKKWTQSFFLIFDPFRAKQRLWKITIWRYTLDGVINTKAWGIETSKRQREDKDISYAKLTHNVTCDSNRGCPSHMWSGGPGSGGDVPNRGQLGCILRQFELLALIPLIRDLGAFRVTQSRARLWGNLITKLTNRWMKTRGKEKPRNPRRAKTVARRGRCNVTKLASKR